MALSADTLLDRIKLKGQVKKWRNIALALIALAIFLAIGNSVESSKFSMPGQSVIARIKVSDVISEDTEREEILREIADNKHIKAVIMHVNSPGGTVVGGESLYYSIKYLAEKKPVVTVMGSMATSAAYMISAPTSHIIARQGTVTGSIGVIMQSPNFSELSKKVGVSVDTVKTGKFKDVPSPFSPMSPEGAQLMQELLNSFYNVFVDMVAEGRKIPREDVLKLADGRIFTGVQAISNNLIDEFGGEEEAISWLVKNKGIPADTDVKEMPLYRPDSKLEEILTSVTNGKFLLPKSMTLEGLLSIWQNSAI